MRNLNPKKVFAQYRGEIKPYEPVTGRKYTITHSDTTAEMFVFIADDYAEDQISQMRDEVRIEWQWNKRGYVLNGSVLVDVNNSEVNSKIRNEIFYREMPTALQALRQADRFMFEKHTMLDNTPVYIKFISNNPEYDKTYNFGPIGDYR